MSSQLKSVRDHSMNFRARGTGAADMRRLWACGHKAHPGQKRGRLLWKCVACVGASRA